MPTLDERVAARDLPGLRAWLGDQPAADVLDALVRASPSSRAVAFRLLDKGRALRVFELAEPYHQEQLLADLREAQVVELMEALDPDDRAGLLDEVPAAVATRLLAGLSPRERALTAELLGYPPESAGRVMSPEYVRVVAGTTVAEALARVRRAGRRVPTVDVLPVTDEERKLIGTVTLRDLVLAEPETCVDELVSGEVHAARVDDDREEAAKVVRREDLLALPVVDHEDRVVGLISVDDAMEVLQAEETEDLERVSASRPLGRPYLGVGVAVLARARVLWLLVLIIAAALTVNVLQVFEDTLDAVVTLALFVPLVIGTGGNAGAQAATTVVRAMAVGELRFPDLPRVVWREARVGLLLGLALAAVSFVPISLLFEPRIAIVVAVTMVAVCAWATLAGSFLPMIAKRLGVDPAVVSAPLITTLVDATGLIIYFLVAQVVLAEQLGGVAG